MAELSSVSRFRPVESLEYSKNIREVFEGSWQLGAPKYVFIPSRGRRVPRLRHGGSGIFPRRLAEPLLPVVV